VQKKQVVGPAVSLFFIAEMPQAFFKVGQKGMRFMKGEGLASFFSHGFVLLTR
jgi:hypothetical protein